jgi:ribose/xylose/arabinose/galactoside ABC-type transport system permease subunit
VPTIAFDVLAGVGLLKRKAWGWWLAALGIGWVVGATLPTYRLTIRVLINIIQGKIEVADAWPLLIVLGVTIAICVGAIILLSKMIHPTMMKKYNVQINQVLAWLVCIFGGLLVGVAYAVFLFVFALGTIALTSPS